MELLIKQTLMPNISRSKNERLLRDAEFVKLLQFIDDNEPSLREIERQFQTIPKRKLVNVIEYAIEQKWLQRENRRYYVIIPVVDFKERANNLHNFDNELLAIKQSLLKVQTKYQLSDEQFLVFGYGIGLGYLWPQKLNLVQPEVVKFTPNNDFLQKLVQFSLYQVKQYNLLAWSDLSKDNADWRHYFLNANEKQINVTYQQIRALLGDVHPDYFLEHLLQLYKKMNRRGTLPFDSQNLYLRAALLLGQVSAVDDNCTLNIPFYNKAQYTIEDSFYQDLLAAVNQLTVSNYFDYLVIYNYLLPKQDLKQQVITYLPKEIQPN